MTPRTSAVAERNRAKLGRAVVLVAASVIFLVLIRLAAAGVSR